MSEREGSSYGGLRLSLGTMQFLIQIAVLLLTVAGSYWSIRGQLELLSERLNNQKEQAAALATAQRDQMSAFVAAQNQKIESLSNEQDKKIDKLGAEIRLVGISVNEMQIALASKGIYIPKER